MCGGSKKRLSKPSKNNGSASMPSFGHGNINVLEMLINTEKKGQRLIEESRLRKKEKLSQARKDALNEIRTFQKQCENKFEEKMKKHMFVSQEFKMTVDQETKDKLYFILCTVQRNKPKAVNMLLDAVINIIPEVHRNLTAQNDINIGRFEPRRPPNLLTLSL